MIYIAARPRYSEPPFATQEDRHITTSPYKPRLTAPLPVLLASALLGACSGLEPVDPSQADAQHSALIERLDSCLANQEATTEMLLEQRGTLEQQGEMLAAQTTLLQQRARDTETRATRREQCPQPKAGDTKLVVGRKEQVWLPNLGLALPARIDTGAETASLDARSIQPFERDGRRWVRFEILHPKTEEPIELERRLERYVSIIQSNTTEPERRPVVKLGIVIGHVNQTAEFTLSNRSHLDYQILVGRNILQDVMVVDVSKKNIAPAEISEEDAPSGS